MPGKNDTSSAPEGSATLTTVVALYVEPAGAYAGIDGVELWDESRDARDYCGPHPVVAHPPCNWWSMPLSKVNRTRYGHEIGRDGGTFAHAWWAVRTFGGVLEHPANTSAFERDRLFAWVRSELTQAPMRRDVSTRVLYMSGRLDVAAIDADELRRAAGWPS